MQATVNGIRMAYTDEGQGMPLVFVHGFPLSRGAWQKQVEMLRSSYRVIAPDLRGLGESHPSASFGSAQDRSSGQGRDGVNTMAQMAEDIHALLKQLNTGPVVLIGHSMGGYVALAFARQFPEMLRGLVLVGTKAGNDTPEAAGGRRATAEKVKAEGAKVVLDAMAPKMLAASNKDERMAAQVRGFMERSQPDGVIGALLGMAERPDSTELLSQIYAPTLIITGADDTIIPPAESEKMASAIKNAQLKVIPNAGHLVAFEQPEEFNRALQEWLKNLRASS
jgi:pimeloyl-ACP methyl ester carboxylesterase